MSPYNRPGWIPVQNATAFYSDFELEKECPRPWRYQKAEDLQLRSFAGRMAMFVGGGYIADLGYNSPTAMKVIRVLENDEWIDEEAVAVFIEFTIFEPSSALFSTIKLLLERFPTGGYNAVVSIKTLSLYAAANPGARSLFQVCQLMLMIVIIVFFFAEIGKFRREKLSYFKQVWNWLELMQIVSTICSLVFFFLKESRTSKYVKKLQENPFETSSTDNIEHLSNLETYVLSFVIFIITIKFLRLIKFNRHVCQVLGTLQLAVTQILSFMIVFFIILLAYTQVGFLVFSSDVDAYSSFYSCLRTMLLMLFGGDMRFHELQSTSRYIAPLFVFGYLCCMAMVLLNMFLAILNDCYYEVKNVEAGDAFADAELGAFMVEYGKGKVNKFKDDTMELVEATFKSFVSYVRRDKQKMSEDKVPLQSSECVNEDIKLASVDTMDDIGSDNDGDDTNPILIITAASLDSIDDDYERDDVSLSELKETILQIGREMRQSMTSIKSACDSPLCKRSSRYDFKQAMDLLDAEDETLCCDHNPSPYFFTFGSYLEDIWQKEEEERWRKMKKKMKKDRRQRRYRRRQKPSRAMYDKSPLLEDSTSKRETVVTFKSDRTPETSL